MEMERKISVEIEGKTYTASYTHEEGMVTVTSGFTKRATHAVSPKEAEMIARQLLREIIEAGQYNSEF